MKIKNFFEDSELHSYLDEFLKIYKNRPFPDNAGGMGLNHSFALYSLIKKLKIKKVYESGIYKGHSTWLIEQINKDIEIVAIDIDLNLREYISDSKQVKYYEGDVEDLSYEGINRDETLFFFDDHTNVMNRLQFLNAWNIKYAIFEDNYPPGQGDSYSIRKIKKQTGQTIEEWFPEYVNKEKKYSNKYIQKLYNRLTGQSSSLQHFLITYPYYQNKLRKPNKSDLILFNKIVKNDYEIQPVFINDLQRWGNDWTGDYSSLPPLFESFQESKFSNEFNLINEQSEGSFDYTYFSFVELY